MSINLKEAEILIEKIRKINSDIDKSQEELKKIDISIAIEDSRKLDILKELNNFDITEKNIEEKYNILYNEINIKIKEFENAVN